jgi:hypothetical protein
MKMEMRWAPLRLSRVRLGLGSAALDWIGPAWTVAMGIDWTYALSLASSVHGRIAQQASVYTYVLLVRRWCVAFSTTKSSSTTRCDVVGYAPVFIIIDLPT